LRHDRHLPRRASSARDRSIEVEGVRHLVVQHQVSGRTFDERDRAALEALTAVGVSAYNRRRLSDEMTYLARHDALTGLHNRAVFTDRLGQALERRAPRGLVGVLYCDLAASEVNDLLGHAVGDRLLTRPSDHGLHHDWFGGTSSASARTPTGSHDVASRLLDVLGDPFDTGSAQVRVRVSIGLAFNDDPTESAEVLINSADTAMYEAKARGKGRIEQFHPAMRSAELDRLELEAALPATPCITGRWSTCRPVGSTGSRRCQWHHPSSARSRRTSSSPQPDIGLIRPPVARSSAHQNGRALVRLRLSRLAGRQPPPSRSPTTGSLAASERRSRPRRPHRPRELTGA
jgi:GGDEF domain-containing protein